MTSLDDKAFRSALGWFTTGVTIITTRGPAGELVGFTANSFTSVSLEPPLVLFSLNRAAGCLPIFEDCAHFAVNVLAEHQTGLSSHFATASHDKWQGVDFALGADGCPILADALAVFECEAHAAHDGGDHRIFLGHVLRMRVSPDGQPLLFSRGSYRRLGPKLGTPEAAPSAHSTSTLDNGGLLAGLDPWVSDWGD